MEGGTGLLYRGTKVCSRLSVCINGKPYSRYKQDGTDSTKSDSQ